MAVATPVHAVFRDVWIFARPLSLFPPLSSLSEGKLHLRHWGVLVTELDVESFRELTLRAQEITEDSDDPVLGIMFELQPGPHKANTVDVSRPFRSSMARESWASFSADYIGMTIMTDEKIRGEGTKSHVVEVT